MVDDRRQRRDVAASGRAPGDRDVTVVRVKGTKHAPTLGGGDDDAISPDYERVLATGWRES